MQKEYWCESNEWFDYVVVDRYSGHQHEHDPCPLTVADVSDLEPSRVPPDVLDHVRQVDECNLIQRPVPELRLPLLIQRVVGREV